MKKIYYLIAMAFMALTFTGCADVPEPYGQPVSPKKETVDPAGSGSVSDPYNVAGAIAKCKEIGDVESNEKFYIKGYAATEGKADASFGNASFYMTDFKDGSGKRFYAYQVAGSDGQKMKEGYTIKVGDEVVIYGKITYFSNKTPETVGKGAAYIVSVNGEKTEAGGGGSGGEAKGTGTLEDPFNAAAANLEAAKLTSGTTSDKQYYIKGKVAKIPSNANYGEGKYPTTANYYISDDGEDANTFYIYASKYLGNKDYSEGAVLKVGDEVIVFGNITNYNGTYETAQNKNYLYSLNGENGGGGGDTPSGETKTVTIAGFLAASVSTDVWYQLTGTIKSLKDGDKYGNFDLEDETGSVYVYGLLSEKGGAKQKFQELVAAQGLQAGTKITIIGNRGEYNGNPQVLNAYFVKVESSGGSGGGGGQSSYSINFKTNGQGEWTINDKTKPAEVEKIWQYDSKYGMKATAFASSTNYASESLLISPKFSLEGASKATLTIKHAINFFASVDAAKTEAQVLISTDGGNNWTTLTLNGWPDKLSWTFFESTADFSAYAGKKDLQIALKYTSTADKAGTWEIESVTIE